MIKTTWPSIWALRLHRGHLVQRAAPAQLVDVVRQVCGLQAQVLPAAELGLGARVDGVTSAATQAALWEQRALVKVYSLRGTVHLHPAADVQRWLAALRCFTAWQGEQWTATYELEPQQIDAVLEAMRAALDGTQLTREQLAAAVAERAGEWARARLASTWGELIGLGFAAGVLCFGPSQGSKVTFARLDQWAAAGPAPEPDVALRSVLQSFVAAYGPTTPTDFARWLGARRPTANTLQQLAAIFAAELDEVAIDGKPAWGKAADLEQGWELPRATVRLLPQYDALLLGGRFGRDEILRAPARERIFSYKNGRFEGAVGLPILLVDGQIAGIWERTRRRTAIAIRVEPFVELTRAQRDGLEDEAERIGAFYEVPAELTIGKLGA